MTDITDNDHEIIIRDLHQSHKKQLIDEKFLLILFLIAVMFILMFIGAFISMITTFLH